MKPAELAIMTKAIQNITGEISESAADQLGYRAEHFAKTIGIEVGRIQVEATITFKWEIEDKEKG